MDQQCLSRVHARFQLDLHPSKLHNIDEGVHEHLNSILFRYQDDLEGFAMAYENVKTVTKHGAIHPYFPLVHVEVTAKVLLFKPTVGCMLVGRVIKVATDFIGLLVLGIFNASIAADSIRSEFKYNSAEQSWASKKHPGHEIKVGTEVRFQVVKLQEQAVFFGIFGSLAEKSTGAVEFLLEKGQLTAATGKAGANGTVSTGKRKTPEPEGADAGNTDKKKKKNKDKGAATPNGATATPNGVMATPAPEDGEGADGEAIRKKDKKDKKKRKLEA